jgi:hypothetical protein
MVQNRCAYVITLARPQMNLNGQGIFQLPAFLVVNLFAAVVPVFGSAAKSSFDSEGRSGDYTLNMPQGYENYVRAGQELFDMSASGASYGWTQPMPSNGANFFVRLDKKGPFEGPSWLGTFLIMIGRHPQYQQDSVEVEKIVEMAAAATMAAKNKVMSQTAEKHERPMREPSHRYN